MTKRIFTVLCLLVAAMGFSQQNYWAKITRTANKDLRPRMTTPTVFSLYSLDLEKIKKDLAKAPQRFSKDESLIIKFPDAEGNYKDYIVQEASVMEPELQAKFPDIRSYTGWQKNNPLHTIRFSLTPSTGMNIMYFDGSEISYLDGYAKDNSSFILYKRKDLPKNDRIFECHVENELDNAVENNTVMKAPLVSDGQFRTYRLAVAATGEYTTFQGGTVALAMAAMATTMTRVNGIYEKTISVTMVMVANNNLIVYTNATTDPYTNGTPGTMITQNQTNINSIIGAANYDIGHVFGTNSGGLAGLGVVCTTSKARGVTGSGAPVGDPFDIDYVAHEMGHQFGANHTFRASSGSCSGNANNATAYEPGSGTTVMAYAGICGAANNVQSNSDAYFHAASVVEMYAVLQRSTDCAVKVSNNNGVPTADAGADYIIPKGTAFVLTGQGTDPDNDPINYLWEQYDNQNNTQPPVATATVGPVYRSLTPVAAPTRYFPNMTSVLANNLVPKWEVTPGVARTLNFSLLVNDNKPTGNQTARDAMVVTVTNDGPFTVTSHAANAQYSGAAPTTVAWDVAGTNTGTINTQNVTILLSKDGGANFNTVLAASVPNNGSAVVNLPNEDVASARIMVKAVNNIYFAVNASNFSIGKSLATRETADVKSFAIYPNPSRDEVNILLKNSSQKAEYTLLDASGRLVKSGSFKGETKVTVNNVSTGNYLISITLENGEKHSEKLIIKK
ncbi:reprolysin-like metallopeptidase [Chryseobacterium sp. SIMBA_029]|uniref:reprolysin-like metallopeptidase n=1 Tax=Chryseobacterium sp. SIMBA_029 TaxID=3085772 RepID=UPI00397B3E9B